MGIATRGDGLLPARPTAAETQSFDAELACSVWRTNINHDGSYPNRRLLGRNIHVGDCRRPTFQLLFVACRLRCLQRLRVGPVFVFIRKQLR